MNTALRNPFMLQEGTLLLFLLLFFLLLLHLEGDRREERVGRERRRDSRRPFISSGSFLVTLAVIFCLSASEEPSGPPSSSTFSSLLHLRLHLLPSPPFLLSCQTSLRPRDLGQITCIQLVEASTTEWWAVVRVQGRRGDAVEKTSNWQIELPVHRQPPPLPQKPLFLLLEILSDHSHSFSRGELEGVGRILDR